MTTAIAPPTDQKPTKVYTVRDLLMDKQQEILAALPRHITPAYFMRVVLTAVQRNPQLAQCEPISFLGAVLQCAQLGLAPDPFLGQAYLIPYQNNKKKDRRTGQWGVLEAQFQPGYKGLVALARRSGEVTTIHAECVSQKDKFVRTLGLNPTVVHEKYEGAEDAGPLTHVYAFYKLREGSYDLVVMNRREVEKIRARSQAYQSGVKTGRKDSPWFTDEEAMWKKTAIKQLLKLAPLSIDIQRVTGLDDAHEAGLPQDLALLADPNAEATVIDEETGEIEDVGMPQRASENGGEPPAQQPAGATRLGNVEHRGKYWLGRTDAGVDFYTYNAKIQNVAGKLIVPAFGPADRVWNGRQELVDVEVIGA